MLVRLMTATAVAGALASLTPGSAHADPPLPPPYVPGAPVPYPGSYNYSPYIQLVPPPAYTDSRGVRIGTNADASQTNVGLPGSKLGNSPPKYNFFGVNDNMRNGVSAGLTPAQPTPGSVNSGVTNQGAPAEDPNGQPPQPGQQPMVPVGGESYAVPPVGPFGAYAPVLESTTGVAAGPPPETPMG